MAKSRVDQMLVDRGLAESRTRAQALIMAGLVYVGDRKVEKPGQSFAEDVTLDVRGRDHPWVSRGGIKLAHGLDHFGWDVAGTVAIDVGSSTGGFTDVLLKRGAREVVAVDVGYGQLVWRLQNDERLKVLDRTNIRHLTPELMDGPADLMVGDLSFISLELVLPAIAECMTDGADLLPMVKPQFEVGKDRLGSGGVVRSPELREEVTLDVARKALELGLSCRAATASPLPGPSGNVEYFLWLVRDGGASAPSDAELARIIHRAVEEGPEN